MAPSSHTVRCVVHGTKCVDPPMTFEDWLKKCELPVGFSPMVDGYPFWDQCMPLDWAIYLFNKRKGKKSEKKEA